MKITESSFVPQDGEVFQSSDIKMLESDERASIKFYQPLPVGKGVLKMHFAGILNDKMKGFYRTVDKDAHGNIKYSAVTQFEPTDARRCFPCWDEPAIKASFDISVIAKPKSNDFVVLSNMPIKDVEKINDGANRYNFNTTPIMSTYLVAIVVGEYEYVEEMSDDGVLVRVYTPLGML